MNDWHPNTLKLLKLHIEAVEKGWNEKHPNKCFCQEVAIRAGELGNEYPSDNAIIIALEMIEELEGDRNEKM